MPVSLKNLRPNGRKLEYDPWVGALPPESPAPVLAVRRMSGGRRVSRPPIIHETAAAANANRPKWPRQIKLKRWYAISETTECEPLQASGGGRWGWAVSGSRLGGWLLPCPRCRLPVHNRGGLGDNNSTTDFRPRRLRRAIRADSISTCRQKCCCPTRSTPPRRSPRSARVTHRQASTRSSYLNWPGARWMTTKPPWRTAGCTKYCDWIRATSPPAAFWD